jgi:ribosomal protein S12 methylthiotransferase
MQPKNQAESPRRVGLVSLGCAKNLVDAEVMLGTLLRDGFEITNDPARADALIINTCSFIDAAQEESVDTILESAAFREAHARGQALIVSGCLPQRFRAQLRDLLPEVDAFMGVDEVPRVSEIVREALAHRAARLGLERAREGRSRAERRQDLLRLQETASDTAAGSVNGRRVAEDLTAPVVVRARPRYIPDYDTPRFRLTPAHYAYVKIAEGCNHPCSFCIIPQMRGSHRSRPLEDIVREVRALLDQGVREFNLISQDSTYYGLDLRPRRAGSVASPEKFREAMRDLPPEAPTLARLLEVLDGLPGDFWVRVLYTHPAHWTEELIRTFAQCRKVVRYVDMPLQHIHDLMLERMRRETSRAYIEDLLQRIRSGIPGVTLRTTFIVGFPGETEACFEALLEFMERVRFDRAGVFLYSREEGTRAARMAQQVPAEVKQRRRDRAMELQRRISRERNAGMVGRRLRVLVEGQLRGGRAVPAEIRSWEHGLVREDNGGSARLGRGLWSVARSEADAPEVDGRVFVRGELPVGRFATVEVVGWTDYDLIARPV